MKVINLYLVHSVHLTKRVQYINTTVSLIKQYAEEQGLILKTNTIKEPTSENVEKNIAEYNKNVDYAKEVGDRADDAFNATINSLNVNQISNIEKHKEIYKMIQANGDELHFIIEDDVMIGEEYLKNIKQLFDDLKNDRLLDWDILFTCASVVDGDPSLILKDSSKEYKLMLNKSSYFIKKSAAQRLAEYLKTYKYALKTAISKFIWDNDDIKGRVLNKHTFLEGSKIGIFPSSLNSTNFLFQNINYVNLTKIANVNEISDDMLKAAEQLYERLKELDSPDVLHTMGLMYFKRKDYKHAKQFMTDACDKLLLHQGYVSKLSEIMNNAVNIHQYDQDMVDECLKAKSKFLL